MYKNYKDDDLIRAYSTMMTTSVEIPKDLTREIEQRGGIEYFKRMLLLRKTNPDEVKRIQSDIQSLTSAETEYDFVRNFISSDYFSQADLDNLVFRTFKESKESLIDKTVSKTTIISALVGVFVGSIAGSLFWWGILFIFKQPFIFIIPVVFIIGYYTIKLITKKSLKNPVVLMASLLCAVISIVAGQWLFVLLNG